MFLEVITPHKTLFSGEVTLAKFPGSDGSFEVMENHAPIISTLGEGQIKAIELNKEVHFYDITGGVIEVKSSKVIALVESAPAVESA
ncbi:MAG TPA: F0F1 ATP synthase subunit epsilon [Sunxiuqinia sp.]|nr:F0F1 ATP synthase subunit epsilon [Sunxiuqinia sp.]